MPEDPPAEPLPRRRRRSRRARGVAIALALLLILLGALWRERRPIASGYVDRALAARGVPARYRIADLGPGRQRLTDVVIGDPARPDLVADWIELGTHVGLSGIGVDRVRAGRLRLRGRLVDGRVSVGALDRLLPAPSGRPFALPAIIADIADARLRLETPGGTIGLKLAGHGRLSDGFAGGLAIVADRLDAGGCRLSAVSLALAIRIARGAPDLRGPARAAAIGCGTTLARGIGADLAVTLGVALDRWRGDARLAVAGVRLPAVALDRIGGTIGFAGSASGTTGSADLVSARVAASGVTAAAAMLRGRYRIAHDLAFAGEIGGSGMAVASAQLAPVARLAGSARSTPAGPLIDRLAGSVAAAGRSFELRAAIVASAAGDGGGVTVAGARLSSASGARIALDRSATGYRWPSGALRLAGTLEVAGGGLPSASIRLDQPAPGTAVTGIARIAPYAAEGARIALAPVSFTATPRGNSRLRTRLTLSGPLGDGRVERLDLPIDALWNGRGRLAIDPDCVPLGFARLATAGLVLRGAVLRLCPVGPALVMLDGGRLTGGARIAAPRLDGRLGSTPIRLAAAQAELALARPGFALAHLQVALGDAARLTRLDLGSLDGAAEGGALAGRFAEGGGQIGNVPLLLSAAAGSWRLAGGRLSLGGAMTVADAAADPRFKPLAARAVVLTLAGGRIAASGRLVEPHADVPVATVTIAHDLAAGSGSAALDVSGITFGKDFQPDALTRLTFGVIADVAGSVSGEGHVRWSPQGVASDGVFRTAGTDLAAAFGPVTGIAGEIRFTDLLALESAPGQVATVKTINPGIAVSDGTIRYRTLADSRIAIEQGRWPFAGGELLLEPGVLDFAGQGDRRLTFRVAGVEAGQFLQQFDFKNLDATGVFDGRLPMVFDQQGGRIERGALSVRPGGGTIAYVGEISREDVGFWGNLAFQALRSLRYRDLALEMNGPLAGEMVTEVRFAGVSQGAGAKGNFLVSRLQKLPFVFNVRIRAPFRSLIDSAASFYDPARLVERNLPALIEEQRRLRSPAAAPAIPAAPDAAPPSVQPPASRTVP